MFEENVGFDNDSIIEDDKTSTNELDGIPDEDEVLSKEETIEDKSKSEIAQKIKYREKFLKSQEKLKKLEEKINVKEKKGDDTGVEEKEIAAQKYIRKQAREEYEAILAEQSAKKEAEDEETQTKMDIAIEDSDFSESQIKEVCEEYEVEPSIAVKILSKTKDTSKKPKMPSPKKASPEIEKEETEEEKKSIYQIAQDIKKGLKKTS